MSYTAEQKLAAIEREIRWRKRVYPNRVETNRMTQGQADYQIDIMQAIASDYEAAAEKERLI